MSHATPGFDYVSIVPQSDRNAMLSKYAENLGSRSLMTLLRENTAGGSSLETAEETNGGPGATRTPDTRFRKPLLYPLSYRAVIQPRRDCAVGGDQNNAPGQQTLEYHTPSPLSTRRDAVHSHLAVRSVGLAHVALALEHSAVLYRQGRDPDLPEDLARRQDLQPPAKVQISMHLTGH